MDEFDLIKTYFAPLAGPEGLGLKDDAAHFSPPADYDVVLTKDTMVEGVHFPNGIYGADIAERLLRVNLSDIAAKAARPRGYLLSVAWPKHLNTELLSDFSMGLRSCQEEFGLSLWGGDTVSTTGPAIFTATLIGVCPQGMSTRRMGASPGDDIWLSGYLGKGLLGLSEIQGKLESQQWSQGFYRPPPRMQLQTILRTFASAAIDVSDGLVADLGHLAKSSAVGMSVEISKLYFPDDVKRIWQEGKDLMHKFLTHGDDYEIVFTAHSDYRDKISAMAQKLDFEVTLIGKCQLNKNVNILDNGSPLEFKSAGYSHF